MRLLLDLIVDLSGLLILSRHSIQKRSCFLPNNAQSSIFSDLYYDNILLLIGFHRMTIKLIIVFFVQI